MRASNQVFFVLFICFVYLVPTKSRIFIATSPEQLRLILRRVYPGDAIVLRDGIYRGTFTARRSGIATAFIQMTGSSRAILTNIEGYGFHLKASFWHLKGFTIENTRKALVLNGARFNYIDGLTLRGADEEGILLWNDSSNNTIRLNQILQVGRRNISNAITVGTEYRRWRNAVPDRSSYNRILYNEIGPVVSGFMIDVKEGTCCGRIRGNTFDASLSAGNSEGSQRAVVWVDIKGDGYRVERNLGKNANYGFLVRSALNRSQRQASSSSNSRVTSQSDLDLTATGCGNVFHRNRCYLNSRAGYYCIYVTNNNVCRTHVFSDNSCVNCRALTNVQTYNGFFGMRFWG